MAVRSSSRHAYRPDTRGRANPSGVHFLRDRSVIAGLLRSAALGAGDLVVEFGAGPGVLTAALAGTGARVLAVERDEAFVRRLRRRFADRPVRVVQADLRYTPLPRRPFAVVANLPFAVSTAALRRLLGTDGTPAAGTPRRRSGLAPAPHLIGADLLVEWGLARRLTAAVPRDAATAWWAARFELRIARRVPAASFSPAPRMDAAHLVVRPRSLDTRALRPLRTLLAEAYRRPDVPVGAVLGTLVPRRRAHRLALSTGIDPPTPARRVPVCAWARLAAALAGTGPAEPRTRARREP